MQFMLALLSAHFLGDFVFQTDRMAINKSSSWSWLAYHVTVYTATIVTLAAWWTYLQNGYLGAPPLVLFGLATWITHFATDAVTSRLTSKLWFFRPLPGIWEQATYEYPKTLNSVVNPWVPYSDNRRHWFFVTIGAGQLIHAWTLYLTWTWAVAY